MHEQLMHRREAGFRTPWGEGRVVMEADRLAEIDLPLPAGPLPEPVAPAVPLSGQSGTQPRPEPDSDPLARWVSELEEFFTQGPRSWTAEELDLEHLPVSPFARAVYRALLQIPPGETVSYGELATLAGHPGAARAVGTAMAANPLALAIPCHRVVRSDGSVGRYGRCDALKPYLLSLEGGL